VARAQARIPAVARILCLVIRVASAVKCHATRSVQPASEKENLGAVAGAKFHERIFEFNRPADLIRSRIWFVRKEGLRPNKKWRGNLTSPATALGLQLSCDHRCRQRSARLPLRSSAGWRLEDPGQFGLEREGCCRWPEGHRMSPKIPHCHARPAALEAWGKWFDPAGPHRKSTSPQLDPRLPECRWHSHHSIRGLRPRRKHVRSKD
jgi:hypothetical protein